MRHGGSVIHPPTFGQFLRWLLLNLSGVNGVIAHAEAVYASDDWPDRWEAVGYLGEWMLPMLGNWPDPDPAAVDAEYEGIAAAEIRARGLSLDQLKRLWPTIQGLLPLLLSVRRTKYGWPDS